MAPDATFRFGDPGRRSETWRRLVAPRRGGAHIPTRYLHPKAKTARNVAPRGAEGPWLFGSEEAQTLAFSRGKSTLSNSILATQTRGIKVPR